MQQHEWVLGLWKSYYNCKLCWLIHFANHNDITTYHAGIPSDKDINCGVL